MTFSGTNGDLMEICEIAEHPFFFGSQFHPEMKSRPGRPSPPFLAFVEAMKVKRKGT
jgi:CTP synthase